MKSPSPDSLKMLETLRLAVNKELERKKRLGQYAVIWKKGKPVLLNKDTGSQNSADVQDN